MPVTLGKTEADQDIQAILGYTVTKKIDCYDRSKIQIADFPFKNIMSVL